MSLTTHQPEYRKDPLSDGWVVIAADRSGRPDEFREAPVPRAPLPCPFCRGNEEATPDQILTYPANANGNWQVRVVPNKFPAVVRCAEFPATAGQTFKNGSP